MLTLLFLTMSLVQTPLEPPADRATRPALTNGELVDVDVKVLAWSSLATEAAAAASARSSSTRVSRAAA